MSLAEVAITLNIQNNVSYPVQMNVLGNPYNLLDTANAKTQFQYNVTGFTFTNESYVVIQYKANSSSSFSTFTQQLQSQNIQGVVIALNLLGIGSFQTYTQGGQTYISTYNDNFTFGQINIYAPSIINPNFFYGSGFDANVLDTAIQTDGKILCVGNFTTYQGSPAPFIIRLNTDGSIDTTFNFGTGFDANAGVVAIQNDGKIIVGGGFFNNYNGTPANGIIRLNTDGSVDPTFISGTGFNSFINDLEIQTDGKILCGGGFTNYNGTPANKIVRLNTNGSIDGTFVYGTAFNNDVYSIKVQPNANILIGGSFSTYNGTGANAIIRLTNLGAVDGTFVYGTGFRTLPVTPGSIRTITLQPDGNILCGGIFDDYNGTLANRIIRLTTLGAVDTSFIYGTGFNLPVSSSILQSDGKLIIGGTFTSYQGTSYNRIIRVNNNGSIDTTWNIGTGFNGGVDNISLFNGLASIGGAFTSFNGTPANYIIQLNS